MSMHGGEDAYERINKSFASEAELEQEQEKKESRKRCITILIVVFILIAAVFALVLVLILKGGEAKVPAGYSPYTVADAQMHEWYFEALLKRTEEIEYPVPVGDKNPAFDDLRMRVSMINEETFRIRINPVNVGEFAVEDIPRWEVPKSMLNEFKEDPSLRLNIASFNAPVTTPGMELFSSINPEARLFSTIERNFVFTERYLEYGFLVDSRKIFGFGERHRSFELTPGEYTSWSNGQENVHDEGVLGNHLYGDHPFVLARLKDNSFLGIFFLNSNAKTLEYSHVGKDKSIINFKSIGGVLDFFTFAAESPEEVIKAYHKLIGKPYFPPFWALGYHQSSWQYDNTTRVFEVLEKHDLYRIPLESIWLDIEYMDGYRNFEINQTRFPDMVSLSDNIHTYDQKLIMNVNAGFEANKHYSYYRQANEQNLLIQSSQNPDKFDGNLIGKTWPGNAAFVDFQNPNSSPWWINALRGLYSEAKFDGIWLDMNELTSFCDGECPGVEPESVRSNITDLPFNPTGEGNTIEDLTISMDAQHYYETEEEKVLNIEYNMHSLYGAMQSESTHKFWVNSALRDYRPFVMSRSTFAGSGKYTSHWLGDNRSTWGDMQLSISGIMNFNMFGIPHVGADVCGFYEAFDDEMCARWVQLSAFYPFARNHFNMTDGKNMLPPQEIYNLKAPWNETAKMGVLQRYSFLRYYYTSLFEISRLEGGTLVRPLFFEFPDDDGSYQDYEHTFFVGDALKVTPVLRPASEHNGTIESYFPSNSRFISLNDFTTIVETGSKGKNITLDASKGFSNVHMKQGSIIPWQNTQTHDYFRTKQLIEERGLSILVFPDEFGYAEGAVYIDEDGDSQIAMEAGNYEYYQLRFRNNSLSISIVDGDGTEGDRQSGNHIIENIYILGAKDINFDQGTACAFNSNMEPEDIFIKYHEDMGYLQINATNSNALTFHEIIAIQYTTNKDEVSFCHPKYTVKSISSMKSKNGDNEPIMVVEVEATNNLPDLYFHFVLINDGVVRILVEDFSESSFHVPDDVFNPDVLPLDGHAAFDDADDYVKVPLVGQEFYFEVHEFEDPTKVLYSTKGQRMVYSKNFMQVQAHINSNGRIFGLGERVGDFLLKEGVYTIWAHDTPSPREDRQRPGNNMYGAHPVYFTQLGTSSDFFAVFDNNAGAQDYIIEKDGNGMKVTQIKTSGVTDMFIILSDNIEEVVREYHELIGYPTMVPDWALGWHQSRWGYYDSGDLEDVIFNYLAYNLPLDCIWSDIDYMDTYQDFTIDQERYGDLPGFVAQWRNDLAIHYVPIIDAAIAYKPNSNKSPYSRGSSKDVFIKDGNDHSKPFVGRVWPGPAVYMDWMSKNAESFWLNELEEFDDVITFDGLWLDMNEAANFCDGHCLRSQRVKNSVQNGLFYIPGARDLNTKSISIDAVHQDGTTEFEAHSLYGFYMSQMTNKYFMNVAEKRPFIVTRSSFSGTGKFASTWLGDNRATYQMMKDSVNGIYNFGSFGIPFVGADICGFFDDTTVDLCTRWYALGAFYPFARNHNEKDAIVQEPFVPLFSDAFIPNKFITYTDAIRSFMRIRYSLHRYQYTGMHRASHEGVQYFKPMFYNYPEDDQTFVDVESNILLGDNVKVSPILSPSESATFYFPEKGATWCPIWPKTIVQCFKGESFQNVNVPVDEVLAHIKSGSVIPLQLGDMKSVQDNINIERLKEVPLDLGILCDSNYRANGIVRFDDGKSRDLQQYTEFEFDVTGAAPFLSTSYMEITRLINTDLTPEPETKNQHLGSVVIYNASQFSFTKNSIAQVNLQGDYVLKLETQCETANNLCRFNTLDNSEIPIRDIDTIMIKSA